MMKVCTYVKQQMKGEGPKRQLIFLYKVTIIFVASVIEVFFPLSPLVDTR